MATGNSDVAAAATELFGVAVKSVRPLFGNMNDSWLVAGTADYVLRRSRKDRGVDGVEWEHSLLQVLGPLLDFVPVPLPGLNGDTVQVWGGRATSLFPFRPGAHADQLDVGHSAAVAAALGRWHRESSRLALRPRAKEIEMLAGPTQSLWGVVRIWLLRNADDLGSELSELVAFVDAEDARVRAAIDDLRGELAVGIIHGDFNPRNVLMSGGEVSAVIDWDDAGYGFYAAEVALAAAHFCRGHNGAVDTERLTAFLGAYRDAGGVFAGPDEALAMFARSHAIFELFWIHDEDRPAGIQPDAMQRLQETRLQLTEQPFPGFDP